MRFFTQKVVFSEFATIFWLFSNIEEDTVTLREFTVEMVVESAAKCLLKINDQLDIPTVLPQSMSTRFRVGATLATACKVRFFHSYQYLQRLTIFKGMKETLVSTSSRLVSTPFKRYGHPKKKGNSKKFFEHFFPSMFYVKTKLNSLQILQKKAFSRNPNILP